MRPMRVFSLLPAHFQRLKYLIHILNIGFVSVLFFSSAFTNGSGGLDKK